MNKNSWKYKKLGDISISICDGDWIESKDQSSEGIRLIQTGNIGNGVFKNKGEKSKYISEDTFRRLKCTEIFPGDVLVSRLPDPIGRSCIIPELDGRMITAVDCSIIRLSEECFPKFYVYYTQSKKYATDIINFTTGSTRKRISRKNLESLKVPVPPKEQQLQIISEFDGIIDSIYLLRHQVKDLDDLVHSLFFDTFGDPVQNEKKWEWIRLGDFCDVTSFKRVLIEDVVEHGIPFIRGTELTALSKKARGESFDFTLFITPEHYERVKAISGVPQIGDLLIPSINADGNIWILDTDEPRYYKDGRVLWVHLNKDRYTSEALKQILSHFIRRTYSSMASGATFAELKLFVLRELNTICPPLSLQQSFSMKVAAIEESKVLLNAQIAELQTLLAARMQHWFE